MNYCQKYIYNFFTAKAMQRRFQYLHIDPMILESLNINQDRVNRIMSILHGQDPKEYQKNRKAIIQQRQRNERILNKQAKERQIKQNLKQQQRYQLIKSYERQKIQQLKQNQRSRSKTSKQELKNQIINQNTKSRYAQNNTEKRYKEAQESKDRTIIQSNHQVQQKHYDNQKKNQSKQKKKSYSSNYNTISVSNSNSINQQLIRKYQKFQLPDIPQRVKKISAKINKITVVQDLNKKQIVKPKIDRPSSVVVSKQRTSVAEQRKGKTEKGKKLRDNPHARAAEQEFEKTQRIQRSQKKERSIQNEKRGNINSFEQYEDLIPQVDYKFSMKQQNRKPYLRDNKIYKKKQIEKHQESTLSNKNKQSFTMEDKKTIKPSAVNKNDVQPLALNILDRQKQVRKQYMSKGKSKEHKNKDKQIISLAIYRQQIQKLIATKTNVQDMDKAQLDMKILKNKHNYLKKFDKKHFSRENQQQFDQID